MFRSRPLRGPGSPPARRGRAVVANPRRVHPYYNAAQPGLQTEGDSPRGGAPQPTAPPRNIHPQPGGDSPPASPLKTPRPNSKAKAKDRRRGRALAAQRALARDLEGQFEPISEEAAVEILEAYTDPAHDDVVFGQPLDQYDLHMANELARMERREPWLRALHEAEHKVQRAKHSSRAQQWKQRDVEYRARMAQELAPETELGKAIAEEQEKRRHEEELKIEAKRRRRLLKQQARLKKRRAEEEARREAERLAEVERLNELHKQRIEEEKRKQEEEQRRREDETRKREEEERRAEAQRKAKEEWERGRERRQANTEQRLMEEAEQARGFVEALQLYDKKWEVLKSTEAPTDIPGDMMPWPVFHTVTSPESITYDAVKEFILHPLRPSAEGMPSRRKIATELLRWHSDKFGQIVDRVRSDHQDAAKQCAGLVERWLTALLTEVQT